MSVGRTLTLRSKLINSPSLIKFIGSKPVGDQFFEFIDTVCDALPKSVQRRAVYDSLLPWAGSELTDELLRKIYWRLAGNVARLKVGQTVPVDGHITAPTWCPVQFTAAALERDRKGRISARLRYVVLSGPLCSETRSELFTRQFLRFVAGDMGFTRPNHAHPFQNPRQFVNMRTDLFVYPESDNGYFERTKFRVNSSAKSWNKHLLKMRARAPGDFECPQGFPNTVLCHLCPVGYSECPAGTHKLSFTKDRCPRCHEESFFDPHVSAEICLSCYELSQFQRKDVQNV